MAYYLKSIRLSKGVSHDEASTSDESTILRLLAGLANDPDCLLAEVSIWPPTDPNIPISRVDIVAQSERINGEWRAVEGELRTRSGGDQALAVLKAARGVL